MKKHWKRLVLGCLLLAGCLGIMMLVRSWENAEPLERYEYSTYETQANFSRQYYVVASYPLKVSEVFFHEDRVIAAEYVVEKKDKDGRYRTIYDSIQGITPIEQELVNKNPYSNTVYTDMTLQPLVDIFGDGEYRVITVDNDTGTEGQRLVTHEYYVVSGEHLTNNDTFRDTFLLKEEDLEGLAVRNGAVTYELTEAERDEFITFILNMRCVAVNEQKYSDIICALRGDTLLETGWHYSICLNIPEHEECYIYNMTGKDLDGNAYQAVFVSGDTAVCLNSEDNLLVLLDALKQKYNQSIQE